MLENKEGRESLVVKAVKWEGFAGGPPPFTHWVCDVPWAICSSESRASPLYDGKKTMHFIGGVYPRRHILGTSGTKLCEI